MMKLMQIPLLVLLMHVLTHAQTQAQQSAPANDVQALLKTEEEIIKSMRNYVRAEKKRIDFIEKYLNRSKMEYDIAIKDVPYYLGNPINAYTIIKRLGPDLENVENILKNKTELQNPAGAFPTEQDLKESALGLATVVSWYKLNASQVANGLLNTTVGPNGEVFTEITAPMTASDCYSIGTFLYLEKRLQEAIPWLEEAYNKVEDTHCEICPVPVTEIIDNLCNAYHALDDHTKYKEWAQKRIALNPNDRKSLEYLRHIRVLNSHLKNNIKENITDENVNTEQFGICIATTESHNKRLACRYAHGPHPTFTLGPLKVERFHNDPDLDLFYDVLSEDDVEAIKALVSSKHWNSTRRRENMNIYRNADFFPVEEEASEAVARASRRAAELLGLSREDWRTLNVVNFGIGKFRRQQRMDLKTTANKLTAARRNISATVIFYLSDVELGGATAFPLLNLTVPSKKRAALFFSNNLPSGETDLLVVHRSCPVLLGTKWVLDYHTNSNKCRIWKTDKGLVTTKIYKKIIKNRQKRKHEYEELQKALGLPKMKPRQLAKE